MGFMDFYALSVLFLSGACMGSFSLCIAGRMKDGGKVFDKSRSRCASCGQELGVLDLVPVFSYLFLKGKCRHCGERIPVECFCFEVFGGAMFSMAYFAAGLSAYVFLFAAFAAGLVLVSAVDYVSFVIPDGLLLGLCAVRLAALAVEALSAGDLPGCFLEWGRRSVLSLIVPVALLAFVVLYENAVKREAMGGGDIKLLGVAALYFEWEHMVFCLLAACLIGIVYGLRAVGKTGQKFQFGPCVCFAAMLAPSFGTYAINWYASFFR